VSAHIPTLRGAFLYLSRHKQLRGWMENSRFARPLTTRFIAGLQLEDAVRVASELQRKGMLASLDYLGENVRTLDEAAAARDAYLDAIRTVYPLHATVSMKITALGLDISDEACRANTESLVRLACDTGTHVELDMEDSSYTDRNLKIVYEMHERHSGGVRAVIQAYLYRSESDIHALCDRGVPVRLCKGAYREPADVAFPRKADVDSNFVKLMRILFDRGTYPAIATHDDDMVDATLAFVRERKVRSDAFEFQMLYGVRRDLQQRLAKDGYQVRLYVPYGGAWYPYFMRRLAERPANVLFLAKNFFAG
jgi:proline dehydrogenase